MEKIGIIGAMAQEVADLKDKMDGISITTRAGMDFFSGSLEGKQVVVVQSGIGKVNAAICTQILIDAFQVDGLINSGIAGSLNNEINIGDVVISTDTVQHDFKILGLGDFSPVGQIPGLDVLAFPADAHLVEQAYLACQRVNPDIQAFKGRIATGDQFIASKEAKDDIVFHLDPLCTEMEGGAVGQVAYLNQVPYVVIRAISDKADGSAVMDFEEFQEKAIDHSIKLVLELLKVL